MVTVLDFAGVPEDQRHAILRTMTPMFDAYRRRDSIVAAAVAEDASAHPGEHPFILPYDPPPAVPNVATGEEA